MRRLRRGVSDEASQVKRPGEASFKRSIWDAVSETLEGNPMELYGLHGEMARIMKTPMSFLPVVRRFPEVFVGTPGGA